MIGTLSRIRWQQHFLLSTLMWVRQNAKISWDLRVRLQHVCNATDHVNLIGALCLLMLLRFRCPKLTQRGSSALQRRPQTAMPQVAGNRTLETSDSKPRNTKFCSNLYKAKKGPFGRSTDPFTMPSMLWEVNIVIDDFLNPTMWP